MLHTLYRFACASFSFLGIVFLFGVWGLIAALASNSAEIFWVAAIFAILFFAPAAFVNTWDDVGD